MIKKLNLVLLVVFGLMFGLKMALSMKKNRAAGAAEVQAAVGDVRSELEPHVYYEDWPPFACEDYLSGHLGFLLDQLRAIFPKAKFFRIRDVVKNDGGLDRIEKDPLGVIATVGSNAVHLAQLPMAPTPLGFFELRLITLRSNPWRYTGPESLDKLRIAAAEYSMDNDVTVELGRRGILKVLPEERINSLDIIKKGEADAIVECCSTDWSSIAENATDFAYEECRHSEPIGRVSIYFRASTNDSAVAAALIRDYEAGMKRIRANGERRRICEYYGFRN